MSNLPGNSLTAFREKKALEIFIVRPKLKADRRSRHPGHLIGTLASRHRSPPFNSPEASPLPCDRFRLSFAKKAATTAPQDQGHRRSFRRHLPFHREEEEDSDRSSSCWIRRENPIIGSDTPA